MGEEILGTPLLERFLHRLAHARGDDFNGGFPLDLIAAHAAHVQLDLTAELVGAAQLLFPVLVVDGEDKGAAVAAAAAACVPVLVGHGTEARILARQAAQGGVDGLLLRADETDLHVATVGQGEHLRSQHRRVGDAEQLHALLVGVVARDDEEPGTVGRGMDVGRLNLTVNPLLLWRKLVEIQLGGRGQRLDDVLQRVLVHAVPQIEELHRHLGIGEELLFDIALAQVLAHRMVVGEVAVVHQRLVQTHERVRATRVPHASFCGIALVRDPHVGAEVLQLVVLHVLLGVAHDLEDQLIAAVRQYEGTLVAQRGVEGVIQFVGIAPHELVFQLARGERLQSGGFGKRLQHRGLDPHHVAVHVGRPYRQSGNVAVIGDVILARGQRHVETVSSSSASWTR